MYALKLELKLNNKEKTLMAKHAGYERFCYNYALSLYLGTMDVKCGSSKKVAAIEKLFTNFVKKQPEYAWTNSLSSRVYKMAFRHFKSALSRFFKRLAEFPVFKRKKDGDSFTVDCSDWERSLLLSPGKQIKLPALGTFRLKEAIPFKCVAQTFTISRTADKWYVSFTIKAEKLPPLFHAIAEPVGIDLGVSAFATLSDGTKYESPKPLKKAKIKLGKIQARNHNKQLGNRRKKIRASIKAQKYYRKLAKLHAKVANQRRDFLHKTTSEISKKYARIRIEDLNVSGMMANHKLALSIVDSGFYEFRRQLEYKAPFYGSWVEVVERWYPSSKTCHKCSHVQPMPLRERVFRCDCCGIEIDRDLNASINLAQAPESQIRPARPEFTPVDWNPPAGQVEAGSERQTCDE